MTLFTKLICCSRKKGIQAFIYIYYKRFDIHLWSSRTGSFYALYIKRLKKKDPKVIDQRSWYKYSYGMINNNESKLFCFCFSYQSICLGRSKDIHKTHVIGTHLKSLCVLIDFSLTVKAVTLIFISGRGSAILSAKQEFVSCLGRANVRAFHENPNRIHTELTFSTLKAHNNKMYVFVVH